MALWPFSLVWPGGLVNNQVPLHSDLNKLDEQQAQAADGSAWTDITFAGNYPYFVTDATGGLVCLYNPVAKYFYSLGVSGVDPVGFQARSPFIVRTAQSLPAGAGLIPAVGAVDPVRGTMFIGGAPNTSSQSRIRTNTGLTTSWVAANTAKAAGTTGPTSAIYCLGTIDKHFIGYASGEIESSTGASAGATWANIGSLPNSNARSSMAFSPTLNRLVVVTTGSTSYITSDDGTTFAARTAPANFHTVFWSSFRSLFYATTNVSPNFYSSPDGITWTSLGAGADHPGGTSAGAVQFFEYRRLIGCLGQGHLALSVDGLASWSEVAAFNTIAGFAARSDNGFQALFANSAGDHKASLRIGA